MTTKSPQSLCIEYDIPSLHTMKKYPKEIFYRGDLALLESRKISIVGTRKPNNYTKLFTSELAQKLSSFGVTIVSGGAMGVDAVAHQNALPRTVAVMANGLDIRYPAVNKNLILEIENRGLVLSSYPDGTAARNYSFVERNEIVVALGEALIITQADRGSGSLRSAEFALAMGKPIYVLPHRIGESDGTNDLLHKGLAQAIYTIDSFLDSLGFTKKHSPTDPFLLFCQTHPTYEEAVTQFGSKVFEHELLGDITIKDGVVSLVS